MPDSPWYQHGEIMSDDGDHGGDIATGKTASVRYLNRNDPRLVVTFYAYATGEEKDGDVDFTHLGVQTETEFIVCTDTEDPGGTELWGRTAYHNPDYGTWDTVEKCEAAALRCVKTMRPEYIDWNGQPF